MHIENLIRMANDIGAFFASEPDKEEAARNIKLHIRRYWEPRMRAQMLAHYRAGGAGLNELAHAAVALLATEETAVKQA